MGRTHCCSLTAMAPPHFLLTPDSPPTAALTDSVRLRREKFPLFISQDGTIEAVHELAVSYAPGIKYLNHVEDAPPERKST